MFQAGHRGTSCSVDRLLEHYEELARSSSRVTAKSTYSMPPKYRRALDECNGANVPSVEFVKCMQEWGLMNEIGQYPQIVD